MVDLDVTPEYPGFGPACAGDLLLVANPVPMGSVDQEVGCENCCSTSRGGGGRRNVWVTGGTPEKLA